MASLSQSRMAEVTDDWPEGVPQWWWKHAFPNLETFWLTVLRGQEPHTVPWLQRVTAEVQGTSQEPAPIP